MVKDRDPGRPIAERRTTFDRGLTKVELKKRVLSDGSVLYVIRTEYERRPGDWVRARYFLSPAEYDALIYEGSRLARVK